MLINNTIISDLSTNSWFKERIPSMTSYQLFYYIQSGGHFYCLDNYFKKRKGYDSILLIYTISGTGALAYNHNTYELYAGDGFIIDCNELHRYRSLNNSKNPNWEFIFIHFNGSESKKYVSTIIKNSSPIFKLNEDSFIIKNIYQVLSMLEKNDMLIDAKSSVLILEILTELYLKNFTSTNPENSLPDPVNDIVYYIERHYTEKITLDDFSSKLNLSRFYIVRLFKQHTGFTIYEYIQKYRLNQAKQLLINTNHTISFISRTVGIEDCSYFCKIFKETEKLTALDYRKHWR